MSVGSAITTPESLIALVKAKYSEVQVLLNRSSKDPETEPYKSKYEAERILKEIKSVLSELSEDLKNDSTLNYKAILSHIYLQLGCVAIDVEETQKGEEYFRDCLNLVENDALSSKNILTVISALNSLGIFWSQKLDANKAFEFLSRAENLYKDYVQSNTEKPVEVLNIILDRTDASPVSFKKCSPLETLYTTTLHHLAEIHFVLGHDVKSAVYCHETLQRQLASEDFDAIEWALNSATLAQFFLKKSGFQQARNHLAAASYILDKYETELNSVEESSEELEAKKERFCYRSADVARCWAKYGLMLLSASKERLLESDSSTQEAYPDELKALNFSTLDLSAYEAQVTAQYILMFEDARLVFFNVRHWLKKAEEYYQLENHASDYAQIVLDMSELYKVLAFYEDDESRQCKMYKREIDCLEDLVSKLNSQYYLDICRQVWFELGETYATIFYLKETQLKKENCPNPQLLKKCNHYADQSINNYINFLNSFKDANGKMPEKFDENWERSTLLSFFYIARMLGKIVTADRQLRFEKTKESLSYYKLVVDYADSNETAANVIGIELGVARDMVTLLPLKLEKILSIPEN